MLTVTVSSVRTLQIHWWSSNNDIEKEAIDLTAGF